MVVSADKKRNPGRGSGYNPSNHFNDIQRIPLGEEGGITNERSSENQFYHVYSQSILNKVDSPDLGMFYSVNPYQGCEHGCIYCYARNTHEYWGWSAGLDFESRVIMKTNAPDLLRRQFNSPDWVPYPIAIAGNTDAYQPVERKMEITRELLKVCLEYRHPVSLITKNALILRDLDILKDLSHYNLVKVHFTITTMEESLRQKMEPRTAAARKRLNTIQRLSHSNVPVDLLLAPVIPGLNNHEIPSIMKAASDCGARSAGYTMIRLNGSIGELFKDWLETHFPDRAQKVWHQIQECHGGKVNDSQWGRRIKGDGPMASMVKNLFDVHFKRYFSQKPDFCFNFKAFKGNSAHQQLDLFKE